MQESTAITPVAGQDMPQEYQQAMSLHNQIMANIEVAATAMLNLCQNLKQMRDDRLYTQLGYDSFEDYTEKAVGLKRRQAYNYITVLEKLPTQLLQSNAHLGITKLELITQVPALDREEFTLDNDLGGMSTREIKEILEKYKQQGEQLSMLEQAKTDLERDNTDLADKNSQLLELNNQISTVSWQEVESNRKIEVLKQQLQEAKSRADELARRPIEVAIQPPDEAILEEIREEIRIQAERESLVKIKAAEEAAHEKAEQAADKKIEQIKKEVEDAAQVRFQQSLSTVEDEKKQALIRAQELEQRLKVSGDNDTVRFSLLFDIFQENYSKIASFITQSKATELEKGIKYQGALVKALEKLKENAATL